MIFAQEQSFLKAQQHFQALQAYVTQAAKEKTRIDLVEREIFSQLLAIGLALLTEFVALHGDGDVGSELTHEQHTLQRLKEQHTKRYLSIFGELLISRFVYAQGEKQKIEQTPLDAQLGLPAGDFSYVLEDWLQRMCVKESFAEAVSSLRTLLGLAPSVRSTEAMQQRVAEHAEAYQMQQAPSSEQAANEGEILVATADGKGVPMRRPLAERVRSSAPRRGKGEKANKKQMAYVGAVYSIAPFHRRTDDVVNEICRKERAEDRPVPQYKQVWAEMTTRHEGETINGRECTFIEMAVECHRRDPTRKKTLVCLLDGEAALWNMQREWLPRAVGVLDLFHVLERLWIVAHCLHAEKSPEAGEFVSRYLTMLLDGKVGYVIGSFKRLLLRPELQRKRKAIRAVITYYANNREHMQYDKYLAAGYPIGSGVAEGACRHVVKDRLEQTGMRWTVPGAQAMLHLRVLYLNGQWDKYLEYHIENEQTALYGTIAA